MEKVVLDQNWKEVWTIELNEWIFGIEFNEGLVHRALTYQLANGRINVAHTKTRGERRWSTRKIYKQKGTGRARMGSNRSPLRKKWGVAFGPLNTQNFTLSMNKKERRKALFCVLSSKLRENRLIILDDIKFQEIKTKKMLEVINNLSIEKTVLLALSEKNELIEKSSANLPNVKSILVDYLNIADLLKYKNLILLKASLEKINILTK
jgi:large subunit ribosomal protein L4